jgi:hypothetical protein
METQKTLSVELGEMIFALSSQIGNLNVRIQDGRITALDTAEEIYFILRQETAFRMTPATLQALKQKNVNSKEFTFIIDVEEFFFHIVISFDCFQKKFLITIE